MAAPLRLPLSEIHDRERKRRILRCLRDGQSLLDAADSELATRQAEWDSRPRKPLWIAFHVMTIVVFAITAASAVESHASLWGIALPGFVAAGLALGLIEEWRSRRRAERWLGRQGIFRDPSPMR